MKRKVLGIRAKVFLEIGAIIAVCLVGISIANSQLLESVYIWNVERSLTTMAESIENSENEYQTLIVEYENKQGVSIDLYDETDEYLYVGSGKFISSGKLNIINRTQNEDGSYFNVVAEEVRSLAEKSAIASQDASSLIEETVDSIKNGMDIAEKNRMEAAEKTENELVDSMVAEIKSAIDSDSVEKISFTDEQLAYCTDNGLPSPFSLMKVEEMIAYKMSDLYNKKNFDGILRVTDLYNANEGVFTGYYTYEFIDFMTEYVEANGKFDSYTSSGSKVYSYGEYSITVSKSAITVKTYDDDLGDSFFEFDVNEKVYTEMWVAGETVEHITKD